MTKYESIPHANADITMTPPRSDESVQRRHSKMSLRVILIGGGVVSMLLVIAIAVYSSTGSSATTAAATVALGNNYVSSSVPSCTFEECYGSNCNHEVAPFTCLFNNGGPHGGCSPTPWLEGTCTTSCDLTNCSFLDIPEDTKSCDQPCDQTFCTDYADRLCGDDVPYQCTSGSAKFGCSNGKLEWTLRTSSDTCSSCCNTNKSCE
ncbi:hypothetical protein FRACYDRAFT_270658 [Fragilariopsis cylindrus CCMP1102]|uniref:Uncharacterized protein n=1 Tax=Fragilariopsis cylindrus CCMP1102 TaxID=635003 RepID=A0A1E7F0H4_9STRA|nr:hypothetical protein FRACYDRAFT_270658 [Fragilariopsis cylindrus CCMP1102]|eukprot:OEU11702.1 hypothetical protein FRACYDRAFT_270658 [Fragilariopsis cylindrus CCMP1102]